MPGRHHRLSSAVGLLVGTVATAAALAGSVTAPAGAADAVADRPTYVNPVSKSFADTFADPSVVRGKDGWWYAYGTSDPLREGEQTAHRIPIARSGNLVDWTYVGDAFSSLRGHGDDGNACEGRQRDRHGDRAVPGRPVDRQRGSGGRAA
jgi:hypothetical protein